MPYPWSVNDVLTASDLNAAIGTGIVSTGLGAWTSYTPTWSSLTGTSPAIGNGQINGKYMKIGRLAIVKISMVTGSTSTYGGAGVVYSWTLPAAAQTLDFASGEAYIIDVSAGLRYVRFPVSAAAGTVHLTDTQGINVQPTTPMTWANGDSMSMHVVYETTT